MANKKISDLAANTTPATTALLEVDDAGVSGKTTIAELMTAGGAGTGDVTESDFGMFRRVRVATSQWNGNIVIATALDDGSTVDSVTIATGDVVLLCAQSTASENGAWVVAASGAPSRPTWFPAAGSAFGSAFYVEEGTNLATRRFVCTNAVASDTIDTNGLTFRVIPKQWMAATGDNPPTTTNQGLNDGYLPGDTYSPSAQENRAWIATNVDAGDLLWAEVDAPTNVRTAVTATTLTTFAWSYGSSSLDFNSITECSHASGCTVTITIGAEPGQFVLFFASASSATITLVAGGGMTFEQLEGKTLVSNGENHTVGALFLTSSRCLLIGSFAAT